MPATLGATPITGPWDEPMRPTPFDSPTRKPRPITPLTEGRNEIPPIPTPPKPRARIYLGSELMAMSFPAPEWVVPDLLPEGLATITGRPKIGKSLLTLQLAMCVAEGKPFFDKPIVKGVVLYLCLEDSPRRLQDRLKRMGCVDLTNIVFAFDWPKLNAGGNVALAKRIEADHPRLVVVDTVGRAFGGVLDWNDYGTTTRILAPLQEMALKQRMTIHLVDHQRKLNGQAEFDPVEESIGSTGKAAVMDTLWGLYRKRGQKDATLKAVGRDLEEQSLALGLNAETLLWTCKGEVMEVKRKGLADDILAWLDAHDGRGYPTQIADALRKDRGHVSEALGELLESGWVHYGKRDGSRQEYLAKWVDDKPMC